jgi:hypothetical protein
MGAARTTRKISSSSHHDNEAYEGKRQDSQQCLSAGVFAALARHVRHLEMLPRLRVAAGRRIIPPLTSTRDKWDHSFQKQLFGRISLHQYKEPPKRVLDLGCGNGLWVIDAAQEWTESSIVGFDLKNIQPNLVKANIMPDLASRIQWVHGNLYVVTLRYLSAFISPLNA